MRILCILALLWVAPAFAGTTISHPDKPVPWNNIIDHCWQFDEDYSDACTGAAPVNLVAVGAPEFSIAFPHTEGKGSIRFDLTEAAEASATTTLAAPGSGLLTFWCSINLTSTFTAGAGIIGKITNTVAGYELQMGQLLGEVSILDFHGYKPAGAQMRGTIVDAFTVEPSGWNFVWWRAAGIGSDSICRFGRHVASPVIVQSASCSGASTLTDATAEKFTIGRWPGINQNAQGYFDDCGWDAANLDDATMCRICSCGVRGEKCSCSGVAYTSEGYNDIVCGNCLLPPCNQAAPTTLSDAAPNWSAAVDHCWNFDGTPNDSCTGATPINLVPVGSPTYNSTNVIQGTSIYFNRDTPDGVQANSTAELAPPAGDTLTMWCWANVDPAVASSMFMSKLLWGNAGSGIGPGYGIQFGHRSGDTGIRDLLGFEAIALTRATGSVFDTFPTNPTGWNFVWWRAKTTAADGKCSFGRLFGASTIQSASCDIAQTAADATSTLFSIGNWPDPDFPQSSTGYYDECGWDANNLSDTSICRICSCGVNGAACACSGTSYISEGRNNSHCGNCALPACNLATPGTL